MPLTRDRSPCWMTLLTVVAIALHAGPSFAREIPFAAAAAFSGIGGVTRVTPADVDRDGDVDLVIYEAFEVRWLENDSAAPGSWTTTHLIAASGIVDNNFFYVGDIDGDGDPDVAFSGSGDAKWVENQNGLGTSWSGAQSISTTNAAGLTDFDGDGDLDVLAHDTGTLEWAENDGTGTFTSTHPIDASIVNPKNECIAIGDVDGDGDPDVVVGVNLGNLRWYENTGSGATWAAAVQIDATTPRSVALADVDRDGDLDAVGSAAGTALAWFENDGSPQGANWTATSLGTSTSTPKLPVPADLDADGDVDIVIVGSNEIDWYGNRFGDGTNWINRSIEFVSGSLFVAVADLDADGDLDVVHGRATNMSWYENETIHRGATFDSVISFSTSEAPESIEAADLDGDGDRDLVVLAGTAGVLEWYANLAGDGKTWSAANTIDASAPNEDELGLDHGGLESVDLDGDGDLDVLASSQGDNRTVWHENTAGNGSAWSEHLITTAVDDPISVTAADLDGDGDLDVIVGSNSDVNAQVRWHANDGGSFTTLTTVVSGGEHRYDVKPADVDRDGDLDLVVADSFSDDVVWYENTAGDGSAWTSRAITSVTTNPRGISLGDLDADGDLDVVACGAGTPERIDWYENRESQSLTWVVRNVQLDLSGCARTRIGDFDADGDLDVQATRAFLAGSGSGVVFLENTAGDGTAWARHDAGIVVQGVDGVVADLDGDADLDIAVVQRGSDQLAFFPNGGGQFALPTTNVAYAGMVDGRVRPGLVIEAAHRGQGGETDAEIATLELRFEDGLGTPLTNAQAGDLIGTLGIYLDDGDGIYEGFFVDLPVKLVSSFSLSAGVQTVTFTDGAANVRLQPGVPRTYFVVIALTSDASAQTPSAFQVTHLTQSSSTGEDRDNDIPLILEYEADTGTGVIQALAAAGDADSDGLTNAAEADTHDTDPLNPDTDGDGLTDGDEVNTHGTNPLAVDSDADGLDDFTEINTTITNPNDPDHDGDGFCDGPGTGGGACTAGDNCPAVSNVGQTNSDGFPAGDLCQCGDVDNDGALTATDVERARKNLVGATGVPWVATRCNVVGPSDAGLTDCTVEDVFLLERAVSGAPVTLGDVCDAYLGP